MARILIIEDNPTNMKVAAIMLKSAGHQVICSDNAADGIAVAHAERPDLILMDIQLPGMDGFEATRVLKSDPQTTHIPVIAVTAHAMRDDESRMRVAGCDDYLPKPYRRARLLETIDRFLDVKCQQVISRLA